MAKSNYTRGDLETILFCFQRGAPLPEIAAALERTVESVYFRIERQAAAHPATWDPLKLQEYRKEWKALSDARTAEQERRRLKRLEPAIEEMLQLMRPLPEAGYAIGNPQFVNGRKVVIPLLEEDASLPEAVEDFKLTLTQLSGIVEAHYRSNGRYRANRGGSLIHLRVAGSNNRVVVSAGGPLHRYPATKPFLAAYARMLSEGGNA